MTEKVLEQILAIRDSGVDRHNLGSNKRRNKISAIASKGQI